MAQTNMEELTCRHKMFAGKNQNILEGKIIINNGDLKNVQKIFCRAYIAGCDTNNGEVKVSGKAVYTAIYQTTENEIKQTSFDTEFTSKIENEKVQSGDFCIARAIVVDTDITGISSSEIKIAAVIDIFADVVASQSIGYVTGCNNVSCRKSVEKFCCISATNKQKIKTSFEIETKDKITEVLLANVLAMPKRITPQNGSIKFDAELSANLVYNVGEFPYLKTLSECVSVCEEVNMPEATENGVFDVTMQVMEIKPSFHEGDITVIVELEISMIEFSEKQVETVVDAFCLQNEINLTYKTFSSDKVEGAQTFNEKISASAEIKDTEMQVDKVAGSSLKNLLLSNVYAGDENFVVEGLATVTVFCEVTGEEKSKQVNSIDVEIPFSVKNSFDGVLKDSSIDVQVVLCDIGAKHKRTNEIEVSGVIKIYAIARNKQNSVLVTDLVFGEIKHINNNTISYVITNRAISLFDLAKTLNIDEDQLLSQNMNLATLIEENTLIPENTEIIIYRQKK